MRTEKYGLDDDGNLNEVNPLAADLKDSIDHLAQGLYTRNAHFIFELIQNAEDNLYGSNIEPSLTFKLLRDDPTKTSGADGALVVENNEVGFLQENIDAICAVGKSTKKKQDGFIGEKGIGFKSVFRVTSVPFVFSNGYQILLPKINEKTGLGFIVPEWVERVPEIINTSITTILLPLDQPEFGYEAVKKLLWEIEPETILFLSKLKEIKIVTDDSEFTVIKDDSSEPNIHMVSNKNSDGEIFKFLLFKKTFDKPDEISHEKRNNIREREVSVAFPVGDNSKSAGKLFAYLPVRFDTGFPFIINADFILPSSREDIQDTPWNRKWLMPCVGELIFESLPILKDKNHISVPFLQSLAKSVLLLNETDMFYPIAEAVKKAFTIFKLIPADDGSFVSAGNCKLASADWLRKLVRQDQLRLLYQRELKWVHGDITEKGRNQLWKYFREKMKIEELTPDGFVRKISSAFLNEQSDQWMIDFYIQLPKQKALWKKEMGTSPLRKQSFIRLQDGSHVSPFDDAEKPNAYLTKKTLIDARLPTVKAEIAGDDEAYRFLLSDLKIPEFDIVAEVIEHVIPKYKSSNPPQMDEHERDIEKIIEAFQTDSQEKRKRLKSALQKKPFVLSRTSILDSETYRRPDALYFQGDFLEIYFSGNSDVGFVCSFYKESAVEIFANLGVSSEIRVECKTAPGSNAYVNLEYESGYRRGLKGFDPNIHVDGLSHALFEPSIEKSQIIWNKICVPYSSCIKGKVLRSSRQDFSLNANIHIEEELVSEEFGKLLINSAWLPTGNNEFKKPAEISLDELPTQFERDEKLSDRLGMKKNVVAKLAEEAGLSLEILEYARNNTQKIEKLIANAHKVLPTFPSNPVHNPERRQDRISEQLSDAPEKNYEKRERSVRTTTNSIDPLTWLRNQYTNDDEQMICQICKDEMPFRKRDGKHYFEKKEVLSLEYLPKEHEAQYLALCPLCAAKYREFIISEPLAMDELKEKIANSEGCEIPILLGNEEASIRFVETHHHDLKVIIDGAE
jgi:hypothetical protein